MKRLTALLICVLLALSVSASLAAPDASPERKVVRVGWYESAFHQTDRFGRRSGYGYEYQKRVAAYTGWDYEYVEGSWSELFEMLVAGKIDLLSDVSYTEARAKQILYSAEVMGSEDYHAFISPENTEISPDDFSTFNGKRVGINKNSIQEQMFVDWTRSHNVHPQIVELTAKTPELLEMLANGEIDVLVTLDTYGRKANVVPVCKVGAADSYFGVNKDRPDLKGELDVAMNRILEDNRNFNQQLTEKFNEASAISSFLTRDERQWLDGHGTIRVGYRRDYMPVCGEDIQTGALTGALSDMLAFAQTSEKNARLSFEARAFDNRDEALRAMENGEIDCLFPICLSAYDGEQMGLLVTDPIVKTEMFAAVRTADQMGLSPEREMVVAVNVTNNNAETFLMDEFPNWSIRYYGDNESAFEAVDSGEADCLLVSNYRINRMMELCEKHHLSTLTTGASMDLGFAVRREDDCLYSILNKVTRLIPYATINASLTSYAFGNEKVTFGEFLKDNLAGVIAGVAVVISVILLLLLWSFRAETVANRGRKIISETERDSLTKLYNRSFFQVYSERLYREHPDRPMDAIVMNVEHFHTLNVLNGRQFGDEVLRTLGEAINDFLTRTQGIAARMEGDFFNVYCAHQDSYQALLDHFQTGLDERFHSADIRLRMGVMPWQKGVAPDEMFDRAWSACGRARGAYKTRLMVYDDVLRAQEALNQRMLNDLGHALEAHELEVYYQPKYNIQCDPPKLNSAEALVRWRHPELGDLSPSDFIPLFESSGQISALDNYVWAETARQIAEWRDKYGVTLPVSVNLSRVDVFDPKLVETLDSLVEKYGLDRRDLNLEVTESAYTENADYLIRVIGELRRKGYVIEMDDFGSGYSSLNMLSSLPVDVLKMDIAFIRNIDRNEKDLRLVELIVDIARYLRVPVVAEGVETQKQLKLLRDTGCDLVQGYYFSRALPAAEFERTILGMTASNAASK